VKRYWLIVTVLFIAIPAFPQSQMTTGMIQGVARDSTGGALPGVTISLRHLGIGISRTYRTTNPTSATGGQKQLKLR
jgi:hypothetical protein